MYYTKGYFQPGSHLYIYKEWDLPNKARYQKARQVKFINNLGHLRGGTPIKEVDKRGLQHLIDVQLLIGTCSPEERKTFFVNSRTFTNFDIFNLHIHDIFALSIIVCMLHK